MNTNLIAEVSASYFELIRLDHELDIIRRTEQLLDSAFHLTTVQKAAGVTNELAVKQMEAQVFNTRSLAREVQQKIFESESRLNLLLGRVSVPISRNPDAYISSAKRSPVAAGVPSDLLLNRPDVRQAEYALRAARADVQAARAAFLPSFNIVAGYGLQSYRTALLFNPESIAYGLVGGLVAPIFNRSEIKANFNYSRAAQVEALYQYHRAVLTAYHEVSVQLSQLDAVIDQAILKEKEVESLDRSAEVSDALFRTGRASYIEVIMVQNHALRAKLELVQLQQLERITVINLYRALGGGTFVVN